ncbi:hypothetical protein BBJ28_00024454 [Nothophytophthora sp. Chile5]|nr:hypothetical protein BBJ28_00024454 [Nothophytophthora sp. Chile5]
MELEAPSSPSLATEAEKREWKAHVKSLAASIELQLNWDWNPFVLLARKTLQLALRGMQSVNASQKDSKGMRWLEPGERGGERVAIVSYPRSGNSLMRGLLEKVTGVYTGCDTRPDRALSKELQQYGMKGEGVVDESVWFVKTHFPERVGWKPFPVKKAILVVRNPWDAIDSYFNMTLTNTHNKSLHESQYERFAERWDGLLRNEIDVWMKFHRYWTAKVDVPIIVVRYEDLLVHRAETLRRVFLFLTGLSSLEGTEWERRIEEVMASGGENAGPYVPRSGKIAASFRHYSDEQFQYILKTANLPLRGFGYDPQTQDFPNKIPLPRRQVKPGKSADAELVISTDFEMEIRKKSDAFGRYSTFYRKTLTDPVIASDGTELNMEEVLAAREKASIEKETLAASEKDKEMDMELEKASARTEEPYISSIHTTFTWGDLHKAIVIALLQPAPEVFALFDNVLILNEGEMMYNGPREDVVPYFETLGFKCPHGRDVADYLLDLGTNQQHKYQADLPPGMSKHPRLASEFAELFRHSHLYDNIVQELESPPNQKSLDSIGNLKSKPAFHQSVRENISTLTYRQHVIIVRNVAFIRVRTFMVVLMGLIYSSTFYQVDLTNIQVMLGVIFQGPMFLSMHGQASQIPAFMEAREVFSKQRIQLLPYVDVGGRELGGVGPADFGERI